MASEDMDMTQILERLLAESGRFDPADADADPHWEQASRVHDWRNYVPNELKPFWSRLSHEARLVLLLVAIEASGREEWE
jgi:hypothetical protein